MRDSQRASRCSVESRELTNNSRLQKDLQMLGVVTCRCRWTVLREVVKRQSLGRRRTLSQAWVITQVSLVIKIKPATTLWLKRWARRSHHWETSNARKPWRSCSNSLTRPNSNLIQHMRPTKLSSASKHSQERNSPRRTKWGKCETKTYRGPSQTLN